MPVRHEFSRLCATAKAEATRSQAQRVCSLLPFTPVPPGQDSLEV